MDGLYFRQKNKTSKSILWENENVLEGESEKYDNIFLLLMKKKKTKHNLNSKIGRKLPANEW